MSRPSLYHYTTVLSRSHADTQTDTRIALQKRGFEGAYQNADLWEHFAFNADTLVVVTNVPLSPSQTYVHVIATSDNGRARCLLVRPNAGRDQFKRS